MREIVATLSDGNVIALFTILVALGVAIAGGLWRVAVLIGRIVQKLDDQGRRLEILETAAISGPKAARERKTELDNGHDL